MKEKAIAFQIIYFTDLPMWGRLSSLPEPFWQAGKPAPHLHRT
jgi:hypothetical protein